MSLPEHEEAALINYTDDYWDGTYTADEFHTWYLDDFCGEADQGVYYEDGEGDDEFDDVHGQDDDDDILFGRRKGKGKSRRRFRERKRP